ncbi:hypothetical protein JW899_00575 [Candidatus Uhrbacteria bacterium]|nr:hypothetical protein [Candidatus Uhrbacteria bacterium]
MKSIILTVTGIFFASWLVSLQYRISVMSERLDSCQVQDTAQEKAVEGQSKTENQAKDQSKEVETGIDIKLCQGHKGQSELPQKGDRICMNGVIQYKTKSPSSLSGNEEIEECTLGFGSLVELVEFLGNGMVVLKVIRPIVPFFDDQVCPDEVKFVEDIEKYRGFDRYFLFRVKLKWEEWKKEEFLQTLQDL